jgi:hypothetical protein
MVVVGADDDVLGRKLPAADHREEVHARLGIGEGLRIRIGAAAQAFADPTEVLPEEGLRAQRALAAVVAALHAVGGELLHRALQAARGLARARFERLGVERQRRSCPDREDERDRERPRRRRASSRGHARSFSNISSKALRGLAPVICSTTVPFLKASTVGIERTL